MRIIYHECKKALASPILLALLVLFAGFNIFFIISNSYFKEELKTPNQLSEKYGKDITGQSLALAQKDLDGELPNLEKMSGQEYNSIDDFNKKLKANDSERYSDDGWTSINHILMKQRYITMAGTIDKGYNKISLKQIADFEVKSHGLTGNAAKTLRSQYEKLEQRFSAIKQNKEHKQWFFVGKAYKMHSFLFRTLFKNIIFESIILIVLATALISNYEFENKTHLVSYSTVRGRHLMKDKLTASLIVATAVTIFLTAITLTAYFIVFDYSSLWDVSIAAPLTGNINPLIYLGGNYHF